MMHHQENLDCNHNKVPYYKGGPEDQSIPYFLFFLFFILFSHALCLYRLQVTGIAFSLVSTSSTGK